MNTQELNSKLKVVKVKNFKVMVGKNSYMLYSGYFLSVPELGLISFGQQHGVDAPFNPVDGKKAIESIQKTGFLNYDNIAFIPLVSAELYKYITKN